MTILSSLSPCSVLNSCSGLDAGTDALKPDKPSRTALAYELKVEESSNPKELMPNITNETTTTSTTVYGIHTDLVDGCKVNKP
ncbi:uncharacterized protein Bfra_005176 [Botrytis fragariae]|uniref:Uncharacterized protein n=1 Tax=Botrytis fragariae TaxID=1964551 RepID=A0A8H6AU55_9HELO|nr:uncharacterized protein Bfra_005176 [Botrytis fragariae]KAF5873712.1 hypothetical protein Bfra_005176 [Botrytis fragariae]